MVADNVASRYANARWTRRAVGYDENEELAARYFRPIAEIRGESIISTYDGPVVINMQSIWTHAYSAVMLSLR